MHNNYQNGNNNQKYHSEYFQDRIRRNLGLTTSSYCSDTKADETQNTQRHGHDLFTITSIPVEHCSHAYAIVLDGIPGFGRVAYSGDCRPSYRFAMAAKHANILIHEATFEDGMEEEAVFKRHSTIGEAIMVGRDSQAKTIILTHFSQRYPRIPPFSLPSPIPGGHQQEKKEENPNENNNEENPPNKLNGTNDNLDHVIFAFDCMKLEPKNLLLAGKLTPALRLLYPVKEGNKDDEDGISNDEHG